MSATSVPGLVGQGSEKNPSNTSSGTSRDAGYSQAGLRSLSISSARTPSANSGWRRMLVASRISAWNTSLSDACRVTQS